MHVESNPRLVRIAALVAVSAGVFFLGACGGSSSSSNTSTSTAKACVPVHKDLKTVSPGVMSVGVYSYPPYGFQKGNEVAGVDGQIITKIAALECLKIKPVPGAASAMIPSIQSGRADTVIGDWYRTRERSKILLLSAPIYLDKLVLISKEGFDQISQIKGKKVGSVLGFLWNDDMKKALGAGNLKLYPSAQEMYSDLTAGRIQVVADTSGSFTAAKKTNDLSAFTAKPAAPDPAVKATVKPGQTNYQVNKSNPGLSQAISDDLAKLRADGTIKQILTSEGFPAEAAEPGTPGYAD